MRKRIKDSNDIRVNTYGGKIFFVRYKGETRKVYGWDKFVTAIKEQMIDAKPYLKEAF